MVNALKALWHTFKFIVATYDGTPLEYERVGSGSMLVISQPSKLSALKDNPVLCKMCNRLNEALLVPERSPLPMPNGMSQSVKGEWFCACIAPQRAIGSKKCLRCDLRIGADSK
jgi:hypothetical protein